MRTPTLLSPNITGAMTGGGVGFCVTGARTGSTMAAPRESDERTDSTTTAPEATQTIGRNLGIKFVPPTPDGTLSEARSSPAGSLAESHSAVVRAAWHEESSPVDTVGFRAPAWGAIRRPTPRCRDRGRSF